MKSDPHGGTAVATRTAGGIGDADEAGSRNKYQFHPLVNAFPRMSDKEIDELADEIRMRGAASPILKRGEVILDDYNRTIACERAEVPLSFKEWDGSEPLAVVITRAILPKTHLTESQRAAIAVPISDSLAAETTPARFANLKRGSDKNPKTAFLEKFPDAAILQHRGISESCSNSDEDKRHGRAAEIAAQLLHVSTRYVYEARKLRDADRQLFEDVRTGRMNLSRARVAASKLSRAKEMPTAPSKPAKRTETDDMLFVGDCLKEMAKISAGVFPLIFADPPYNLGWRYDADPTRDLLPAPRYLEWCRQWIEQCARLLTSDGSMFVLIDARWQHRFCVMLEDAGLHWRNTIIWRDPFPTHTDARFQPSARFLFYFTKSAKHFTWNADAVRVPSRRDEIGDNRRVHDRGIVPHDVWDCPRIVGNAKDRVPFHDSPPQVPALILERCILAASNEGDRVFDPFVGNGTTWRAARKLARKFTGCERSKKYADQARQWALSKPD